MKPPEIIAAITAEPTDDGRVTVTLRLDLQSADLLAHQLGDAVIAAERQ